MLAGDERARYADALARLLDPPPQTVGILTFTFGSADLTQTFFASARELAMKYGAPLSANH
jgi:hypothetical protein